MQQLNIFDAIEENKKEVRIITRAQAKDFILNKHYAQRWAPISYFYGLFINGELVGVCTIGKPGSKSLIEGLLGIENKGVVYELNRLITLDGLEKNVLSYFVGQVLRDIKKQNIVLVSYADSNAGHCGYIYQATNWIYTGTTRKNSLDYYVPNGKHSRSYTEADREKYKDLRILRSVKHRYIYFACNKTLKKKYLKLLKYPIVKDYPKEKNENYVLGERVKRIIVNKVTGERWRE